MKIDKLNFVGFIGGNTGYSVLSRALINLMDKAGIDIRVEDLNSRSPLSDPIRLDLPPA